MPANTELNLTRMNGRSWTEPDWPPRCRKGEATSQSAAPNDRWCSHIRGGEDDSESKPPGTSRAQEVKSGSVLLVST
jgi:hypothetical protein